MVNFWCNLCFLSQQQQHWHRICACEYPLFRWANAILRRFPPPHSSSLHHPCVCVRIFFSAPPFPLSIFRQQHKRTSTYANVLLRFGFSNFDCSISQIRRFSVSFSPTIACLYASISLALFTLSPVVHPQSFHNLVFDHDIVHVPMSLLIYLMHFIFDCVIEFQSNSVWN